MPVKRKESARERLLRKIASRNEDLWARVFASSEVMNRIVDHLWKTGHWRDVIATLQVSRLWRTEMIRWAERRDPLPDGIRFSVRQREFLHAKTLSMFETPGLEKESKEWVLQVDILDLDVAEHVSEKHYWRAWGFDRTKLCRCETDRPKIPLFRSAVNTLATLLHLKRIDQRERNQHVFYLLRDLRGQSFLQ